MLPVAFPVVLPVVPVVAVEATDEQSPIPLSPPCDISQVPVQQSALVAQETTSLNDTSALEGTQVQGPLPEAAGVGLHPTGQPKVAPQTLGAAGVLEQAAKVAAPAPTSRPARIKV